MGKNEMVKSDWFVCNVWIKEKEEEEEEVSQVCTLKNWWQKKNVPFLCVCEPFLIVFECVIRARMRERERAGTSFHILNSLTRQLRVNRVGNYFNLDPSI
jgi:hypothetical protein